VYLQGIHMAVISRININDSKQMTKKVHDAKQDSL
jgi:hypothetical protein